MFVSLYVRQTSVFVCALRERKEGIFLKLKISSLNELLATEPNINSFRYFLINERDVFEIYLFRTRPPSSGQIIRINKGPRAGGGRYCEFEYLFKL